MSGTRDIQDRTIPIIATGDMSANITSLATDLQGSSNYSIQVVYTGLPNGTLKLQISNDNITYSDYTGSSTSIAAAGSTTYKVIRCGERYVQVVFTFSSGSGVLNSTIAIQG